MNTELPQIIKAVSFAAKKHRDQRRKDVQASPYINHPIALASILVEEVGIHDMEVICAAILHDTVEDTDTSIEELRKEFGEVISGIVDEVTDDEALEKSVRKRRQVEGTATASDQAKLVKLADKIANLRDIALSPPLNWSLERQQTYFDWALEVIDQLRGAHAGLEQLFDEVYRKRPR